jgi:hypothetical protein
VAAMPVMTVAMRTTRIVEPVRFFCMVVEWEG